MSGITGLWEWIPSWILTALNFGQAYPEGDEDDLWALGDAWEKAAADLRTLEPEVHRVIDRVRKYYTGEGSEGARAEMDKLFAGPASISENAKAMEELAAYSNKGGTSLEYTKIMEATFAGITAYAVIQLMMAWPWGELGVPLALGAGREALGIAAEQGARELALEAGEVGLKNLLRPYLKQIGLAGLKMAGMGAGIDAGIQGYQIAAGHRDGFDLTSTLRTGFEWGVGGLVGAPVGLAAGSLLGRTALSPALRGLFSGVIGGAAGGVGMYGAGIGWQVGDQLAHGGFDWSKIDKTFHPQLLAAGIGLGALHGVRGGLRIEGAPRTGESGGARTVPAATEPRVVNPETVAEGKRLFRDLSKELHPDKYEPGPARDRAQEFYKRVTDVKPQGDRYGDTHVAELKNLRAEWDRQPPIDGSTARPETGVTGPAHTDSPVRTTDVRSEPVVRQGETGVRPVGAERVAGASGTEARVTPERAARLSGGERGGVVRDGSTPAVSEKPSARAGTQSVSPERGANVVARPQDAAVSAKGSVEGTGTDSSRPRGVTSESLAATPESRVGTPESPAVNPESRPVTPESRSVAETGSRAEAATPLESGPATEPRTRPEPSGVEPAQQRNGAGRPRADLTVPRLDDPGSRPHGRPELVGAGRDAPGGHEPHRGTAGEVGEFRGDARVGVNLSKAVPAAEIMDNLGLITPDGMAWHREGGYFVLRDGRTVTLRVAPVRDGAVAEYTERPDGGYEVRVSPGTKDSHVARAVAHELAEIQVAQDFSVLRDPSTEHPTVMTDHLAGRFAELRVLTGHIDRAVYDPARAGELPGLRADLAALVDHLGIREGPHAENLRGLLAAHDAALARRLELDGAGIGTRRPVFDRNLTEPAYEQGRADHLGTLGEQVTGPHRADLLRAESMALDARMREEAARRVFDPLFSEPGSADVRRTVPTKELLRGLDPINEAINDPGTGPAARARAVHEAIDRFHASMPEAFRDAFGPERLARMHDAADGLAHAPERGLGVLDHANGELRVDGTPTTLREFLHEIDRANRAAGEHGLNLEYAVVVHDPVAGRSTVEVLPRPRPQHRLPLEQNAFGPENRAIPLTPREPVPAAAAGGHTVDVGVGRSAYAVEMTPVADRVGGGLIIKTELADDFVVAGQRRRTLGILDPGPLTRPGTVTVFGDLLFNGHVLGEGGTGGVARIFVNNVSAKLPPEAYDALAARLPEVLAPGGRIELQWDMKPERAIEKGGRPGDRGHITGPELWDALQRLPGEQAARFRILEEVEFPPPGNKDYDYTIDAGASNRLDTAKMAGIAAPRPEHRMVISYEPAERGSTAEPPPGDSHAPGGGVDKPFTLGSEADRITDAKVPGSERYVDLVGPLTAEHHAELFDRVNGTIERVVDGHGGLTVETAGDNHYRLTDAGGTFDLRFETAGLGEETAAQTLIDHGSGEHTVQLNDRLRPDQVERSVAHEVGEIVENRRRFAAGEQALRPDAGVLRPGPLARDAAPTPHDHGRVQELRVLAEQSERAAPAARADDPVARAHADSLRREALALAETLGLRDGTPGAPERRALVAERLTGPAREQVGRLLADVGRPESELAVRDREFLADVRLESRAAGALDFLSLPFHKGIMRAHQAYRLELAALDPAHPVVAPGPERLRVVGGNLVENGESGARWYRWPLAAEMSPIEPPPDIGLPTAPEHLHEAWSRLTPEEKDAWYRADPFLGNRDGIPQIDRDHYNRQTLAVLRARAEQAGDQPRLDVIDDMRRFLDATEEGLPDHYLSYLDENLRYVYALGNPDTAQNIAVELAGAFRRRSGVGYAEQTLKQLRQAALAIDPTAETSTILFGAYDNPNSLVATLSSAPAEEGAAAVRGYHDGLRATHQGPPPHITTIAHSYGGVTGGHAAGHGHALNTDALVFVGSWGTGVENVGSLRLTGVDPAHVADHVFATMARYDSILLMPVTHGPAPTDPAFGATVFEADSLPSGTRLGWNPEDHLATNYFSSHNRSYRVLGFILTGHEDLLR